MHPGDILRSGPPPTTSHTPPPAGTTSPVGQTKVFGQNPELRPEPLQPEMHPAMAPLRPANGIVPGPAIR